MTRTVALLQGVYYIASGVWPLLSIASFETITGPKTDDWLVHTVGVLVIVIGFVLLSAALKRQINMPVAMLAIGTAAVLAAVESFYAMRGIIWPVYLLDAVAEAALIVLWMLGLYRDRRVRTTVATGATARTSSTP